MVLIGGVSRVLKHLKCALLSIVVDKRALCRMIRRYAFVDRVKLSHSIRRQF
jgi:hypothetical protein